jgi:radical SAM protein with 4Fe4S-binding SPASM domain
MDPNTTIKKNLSRRAPLVNENVRFFKKIPLPTWIELSLIDVCNRKCSFCPKADLDQAPDTYMSTSKSLIDKLCIELEEIGFAGSIALCGYGEPLLHKDIIYIAEKLSKVSSVEIVTNGDVLNAKMMKKLYSAKVSRLLISLYDGEHQINKFKKIAKEAKVPEDFMILRDRWYSEEQNFGVKLTNRAGTINIGNQIKNIHTFCYYPAYQFLIDWNGDVFLCPQDWHRRNAMGNSMLSHIFDIWNGKILTKYRKNLLEGKRCSNPCTNCNANGTLLGQSHASLWRDLYKLKI